MPFLPKGIFKNLLVLNKNMNFMIKKILLINPKSPKMLFLLFPPIYGLWLFAVGDLLLYKTNKKTSLYKTISVLTIGLFISCFLIPFIMLFLGYNIDPKKNGTEFILAITCISWIWTIAALSRISVNMDRKLKKDNRYYTLIDLKDYINRFFELFFWPYNMSNLQEIIQNKYLK